MVVIMTDCEESIGDGGCHLSENVCGRGKEGGEMVGGNL